MAAKPRNTSAALCALLASAALASGARAQEALPDIDVGSPLRSSPPRRAPEPASTAPTPVAANPVAAPAPPIQPAPALIAAPAAVHVITAQEIADTKQFDAARALERVAPGVSINDVSGNPFSPEVDYRGFVASPVSGTPIGLAVYQNGVRINEAWGDTVNWDLIPSVAIDRTAIVTGNPLFGLNAIGGAVVLDMKNGFTYQGFELDGRGGSFARRQSTMQYGVQAGDFASYLAIEAAGDNGYRKFSGSQIERLYGDVGYRGDRAEVHFTLNLAQNRFGASGPAPADLVNIDPGSVYTTPQTSKNTLSQYGVNATFTPAPNWKILTDIHYRAFDQAHVDGNTTDFASCGGATLCDGGGNVTGLPDAFGPSVPLAVTDRTWTRSRTLGGTAQVENSDKIMERPNKFTFGVSFDHGWTNFNANEQLGVLNPYDLTVAGLGVVINEPASDVTTVKLNASNSYLGVYALDALDLTDQLTVTAGARYNYASIALYDLNGTSLNGNANYTRVNPMAGLTYKITPEIAAYASYSEANRAPTPLELGCANPNQPCLIDNFLVSDPPLKQVVSQTIESGLRGNTALAQYLPQAAKEMLPGRLTWSAGVFRTLSFNDILSVPSTVTGLGYFTNAGTTQRQGVETQWRYTDQRLSTYINYTLTDATFRSLIELGSPYNPLAAAMGASSILVTPGAHMTAVPKHRLKAGFDYALTNEWKIGADVVFSAGTWVRGDEINAFGTLPSYATVNLRSSYQITKNFQLYGLIENAGDTRVRSFGAFFNTTQIPFLSFADPRQVSVGPPVGFFGGAKLTF
jgi:iron complex outermembrane receptor protein